MKFSLYKTENRNDECIEFAFFLSNEDRFRLKARTRYCLHSLVLSSPSIESRIQCRTNYTLSLIN